jgi:hypothetical protein
MAELRLLLRTENIPKLFVALMVGYSHVRSTGFAKAIAELSQNDNDDDDSSLVWITTAAAAAASTGGGSTSGTLRLTPHGLRAIPTDIQSPTTIADVQERLLALAKKVKRITGTVAAERLDKIWAVLSNGQSHDMQELLEASGYTHVRSTGFSDCIAALKELNLVEKVGTQQLKLSSIAFPF